MKEYPLIFIVGPTAVGKSDVALDVAREIDAEIISCDSMMVYKEPQIIVNKPDSEMRQFVKHHMLDLVSVKEEFNAAKFRNSVGNVISDNYPQKNLVLVGGTGMYVKTLLDGLFDVDIKAGLKEKWVEFYEENGQEELANQLKAMDPLAASEVELSNPRRVIRALEVFESCGESIITKQKEAQGIADTYNIKLFCLDMQRDALYKKINWRTKIMFDQGIVEEVKAFYSDDMSATAAKILGLEQVMDYVRGRLSYEEAIEFMAQKTRNYAKRQLTWFRNKEDRAIWIDRTQMTHQQTAQRILKLV